MKTGIDLIIIERREQVQKHERTLDYDIMYNPDGALIMAAQYCTSLDPELYPGTWDKSFRNKISKKPLRERLVIAGALLAAELDRLYYVTKPEKFDVWDYVKMNDGKVRQITNDDMKDLLFEDIKRRATPKETADFVVQVIEGAGKSAKSKYKKAPVKGDGLDFLIWVNKYFEKIPNEFLYYLRADCHKTGLTLEELYQKFNNRD